MKTRHDDRVAACDARYETAKATVRNSVAECGEAANLQAAKDLGIRKSERKTVRDMLASLGGTLGVSAGVLSIVAVALGLTAGAIPIAGWAIAGVVGMIAAGALTWELVNKVRANLKHLATDPAFRDRSEWGVLLRGHEGLQAQGRQLAGPGGGDVVPGAELSRPCEQGRGRGAGQGPESGPGAAAEDGRRHRGGGED